MGERSKKILRYYNSLWPSKVCPYPIKSYFSSHFVLISLGKNLSYIKLLFFSPYGVKMNKRLRSTDLEGDSVKGVREWHP